MYEFVKYFDEYQIFQIIQPQNNKAFVKPAVKLFAYIMQTINRSNQH